MIPSSLARFFIPSVSTRCRGNFEKAIRVEKHLLNQSEREVDTSPRQCPVACSAGDAPLGEAWGPGYCAIAWDGRQHLWQAQALDFP